MANPPNKSLEHTRDRQSLRPARAAQASDPVNVGRFIIRLAVASIVGGLATVTLFFGVAWARGQLAGGGHSDAALMLLLLPVAVVVVFWLLVRAGFPESSRPSER